VLLFSAISFLGLILGLHCAWQTKEHCDKDSEPKQIPKEPLQSLGHRDQYRLKKFVLGFRFVAHLIPLFEYGPKNKTLPKLPIVPNAIRNRFLAGSTY
jgi:hypothetical protein